MSPVGTRAALQTNHGPQLRPIFVAQIVRINRTAYASGLKVRGGDVGVGLEVTVLTATVLGGISLGGGKGSVAKALVGTLIVLFVINGLTTLSVSGGVNRMVLAGVLLVAAMIDIRWLKNRTRIISKVYVSPTFHGLAAAPSTEPGTGPFAQNDKLRDVTLIGLGRIEAPEDVILDRNDNLYAGSRHGDIIRAARVLGARLSRTRSAIVLAASFSRTIADGRTSVSIRQLSLTARRSEP